MVIFGVFWRTCEYACFCIFMNFWEFRRKSSVFGVFWGKFFFVCENLWKNIFLCAMKFFLCESA